MQVAQKAADKAKKDGAEKEAAAAKEDANKVQACCWDSIVSYNRISFPDTAVYAGTCMRPF